MLLDVLKNAVRRPSPPSTALPAAPGLAESMAAAARDGAPVLVRLQRGSAPAASAGLDDAALAALLPRDARVAAVDPSREPIPAGTVLARVVEELLGLPRLERPGGEWVLTNGRGDLVYRVQPCLCQHVDLRSGADLTLFNSWPQVPSYLDTQAEARVVTAALELHREHERLRRVPGGEAGLAAFEARFADPIVRDLPCRVLDGGRLARLDPSLRAESATPAALVDAALREEPAPAALAAHVGLLYLETARAGIDAAVREACAARDCRPHELPLSALPVPRPARERLAAIACFSAGLTVGTGTTALDVLAGHAGPRPSRTPDVRAAAPVVLDMSLEDALAAAAEPDAPVLVYTSSRLSGSACRPDH